MENTKIECSGRIATVEDALSDPENYELSLSWLGWTLNEIGSGFSTFVSETDGERVMLALLDYRKAMRPPAPSPYDGMSDEEKRAAHNAQVQQMMRDGA